MDGELLTSGCFLGLLLASCGAGETGGARLATTSDEQVLEDFFETFAGRPLSRGELTGLTQEFYGDGGTPTPEQRGALDEALDTYRAATERLSILEEPDPVLVVDARAGYVMTKRDVLAFVNIANFSRGTAPPTEPHHRDLTEDELALVAKELDRSFGARPTTENFMPQFYSEAAAFWAGVRREWGGLTSQERELAWLYPSYTFQVNMTDELFGKVWGLDTTEAKLRNLDDTLARTWAMVLLSGEISMYIWFMGDVSQTFTDFWLAMGAW